MTDVIVTQEDIEQADWLMGVCKLAEPYRSPALQAFARHRIKAALAMQEALTPSGDTKAAYMGEFSFFVPQVAEDEDGEPIEIQTKVYVPWTTIKEIMAAILARASAIRNLEVPE